MAGISIPPTITCHRDGVATVYQYGKDCGPIGYKTMEPKRTSQNDEIYPSPSHTGACTGVCTSVFTSASLVHLLVHTSTMEMKHADKYLKRGN